MQKFINVLAVLSFGVSTGVVTATTYVYLNQEELKEEIKGQVLAEIGNAVQSQLGQMLLGGGDEKPAISLPTLPF